MDKCEFNGVDIVVVEREREEPSFLFFEQSEFGAASAPQRWLGLSVRAVIACKPVAQPYLAALLPKDQVFEQQDEEQSKNGPDRPELVDNPYLRSVKMPRKRKR